MPEERGQNRIEKDEGLNQDIGGTAGGVGGGDMEPPSATAASEGKYTLNQAVENDRGLSSEVGGMRRTEEPEQDISRESGYLEPDEGFGPVGGGG